MRDWQTNHPRILRNSHLQRETNTVSGFCLWSLWQPYMIDMVKLWYGYAGCGFYVTLQPSLPQRSLCELHPTQTRSNWPLWCCLPNFQAAWKQCQIASNCTERVRSKLSEDRCVPFRAMRELATSLTIFKTFFLSVWHSRIRCHCWN